MNKIHNEKYWYYVTGHFVTFASPDCIQIHSKTYSTPNVKNKTNCKWRLNLLININTMLKSTDGSRSLKVLPI